MNDETAIVTVINKTITKHHVWSRVSTSSVEVDVHCTGENIDSVEVTMYAGDPRERRIRFEVKDVTILFNLAKALRVAGLDGVASRDTNDSHAESSDE